MERRIKVKKVKVTAKAQPKKKLEAKPVSFYRKRGTRQTLKAKVKGMVRKAARRMVKKIKVQPSPQEFIGEAVPAEAQRYKAEETKYYPRPTPYMPPREWEREELPSRYGDNKIVVLVRDPHWVYAYWEITDERKSHIEKEAQARWDNLRKVLRVYDVTGVTFDGTNANRSFDIDLTSDANNWYINVGEPNRAWCVDLGVITSGGRFILIARSNIVSTPRDRASEVVDEEWMSLEEEFAKLYGISGGFGISSPQMAQLKKRLEERLQKELASGAVSSFARPPVERGFWLVVNTELIVYGATEANASVTVQGRPIKLNRDGTFSLRFALPDGEQVIPVKAVSADREEERIITPIVKKYTK